MPADVTKTPVPAAISTVVHFSPTRPERRRPGNWIRTGPGMGWFVMLRLFRQLRFIDNSWRAGEIERVA